MNREDIKGISVVRALSWAPSAQGANDASIDASAQAGWAGFVVARQRRQVPDVRVVLNAARNKFEVTLIEHVAGKVTATRFTVD